MLKMALLDCAVNEKCCSVDGGQGICPHFLSPPQEIWQLMSPSPGKKMLMSGDWVHYDKAKSSSIFNTS